MRQVPSLAGSLNAFAGLGPSACQRVRNVFGDPLVASWHRVSGRVALGRIRLWAK